MAKSGWANVATSCGSSRALDESLVATATSAWSWVALEVPQAWGRKALPESDLPPNVIARLTDLGNSLPGGRVIFIKRNDRQNPDDRRLYLARSQEGQSILYRVDLSGYEELLDLDVRAILEGGHDPSARRVAEPLFLVCTNGKRDMCCARYGIAAYNELTSLAPDGVWRSSHQGGHRFAANLIILPDGLHYGRIDEARGETLYEAHHAGRILLDHFRGRTHYPGPVNAAEHQLRSQHPDLPVNAISVLGSAQLEENRWSIELAAESLEHPRLFEVEAVTSAYSVIVTSGTDEEEHVLRYRVIDPQTARSD